MKKLIIFIAVLGAAWSTGKADSGNQRDSILRTLVNKEKVWLSAHTHYGRHQTGAIGLTYLRSPRLQYGLEYGFSNRSYANFHLNEQFILSGSWVGLNIDYKQPLYREKKNPAHKLSATMGLHHSRGASNITTYNSFKGLYFNDYTHKQTFQNYKSRLWCLRMGGDWRFKDKLVIAGGISFNSISSDYHYNEVYASQERERMGGIPLAVHPKVIDNLLSYYATVGVPLWRKTPNKQIK